MHVTCVFVSLTEFFCLCSQVFYIHSAPGDMSRSMHKMNVFLTNSKDIKNKLLIPPRLAEVAEEAHKGRLQALYWSSFTQMKSIQPVEEYPWKLENLAVDFEGYLTSLYQFYQIKTNYNTLAYTYLVDQKFQCNLKVSTEFY